MRYKADRYTSNEGPGAMRGNKESDGILDATLVRPIINPRFGLSKARYTHTLELLRGKPSDIAALALHRARVETRPDLFGEVA